MSPQQGPDGQRLSTICGAVLVSVGLLLLVGVTPPAHADALRWLAAARVRWEWSAECFIFGSILLATSWIPRLQASAHVNGFDALSRGAVVVASGLFALLSVVVGRAVYPVFGLDLTADQASLLLAASYSIEHTIMLALVGAMLARAISQWQARRSGSAVAALAAGVVAIPGAFPWLAPTPLSIASILITGAWLGSAAAPYRRPGSDACAARTSITI